MQTTLGMWKGRFPGISLGLDVKPDLACAVIMATCMLHNFALSKGEQGLAEEVRGEKQPQATDEIPPTAQGENIRKQILQTPKLGQK